MAKYDGGGSRSLMTKNLNKIINSLKKIIEDEKSTLYIEVLFVVLLIAFMIFVYSKASARDVPLNDIENKLIDKTDICEMQKCNDRQLKQFIGIDVSSIDEYIYYKSKEALGVDELLIVKVKDREKLKSVQSAVEKRVDSQIDLFDNYGPKQVKLLKDSVIIKKGPYIFYCTGKHKDKYEEVFKNAI